MYEERLQSRISNKKKHLDKLKNKGYKPDDPETQSRRKEPKKADGNTILV